MAAQRPLELVTAYLDAVMGKDLEKAATFLADDFVFEGPMNRFASAKDFLAGFAAFAEHLQPGWRRIAAFGDDRSAFLLYDMVLASGATVRAADYYTVGDGKLLANKLVFDTYGLR